MKNTKFGIMATSEEGGKWGDFGENFWEGLQLYLNYFFPKPKDIFKSNKLGGKCIYVNLLKSVSFCNNFCNILHQTYFQRS